MESMLTHIRESNAIEGIHNEQEVIQSLEAWEWLIREPELTNAAVCEVQRVITLNQSLPPFGNGYYRDMGRFNVSVGAKMCPHFNDVPSLMSNWLYEYTIGAADPWKAHIEFEKIHPFLDGNGRTGRLLLWWHQLGEGFEPSLILNRTKYQEYYPLFSEGEQESFALSLLEKLREDFKND